jgi:hypothetical protein
MLAITFRWIEVGNLGSQLNKKKYGEKDAKEACQLNLYPRANNNLVVNLNIEYDPFEVHIFINHA